MSWQNKIDNIDEYYGFVYIIINKINNKKYIGKKFYWSYLKRPPLKGKKNRRIEKRETDWKDYWGSSNELLNDIKKYGQENFERKILYHCENKFDCAYKEIEEQIKRRVLFKVDYYNKIINVRLSRR